MTIFINTDRTRAAIFIDRLARELPELPVETNAASLDPEDVRYMLTWTVPDDLSRYRNLEVLFSTGAGVRPCGAFGRPHDPA